MWKKAQYSDSFRSIREKITKFTEQLAPSAHLIKRKLRSSAQLAANMPTKEPFSARGWATTMRKNEIIINRSLKPSPRHYPSFIKPKRQEK
ncbi:MAG: hypothetical protein JSV99_02595 [Planctomycetota bacterium]|nr:MAG: hypothetical protein JSV99_02595 [Planctomycetota bacterium]